jgi:hypothetical protein
MNKKWDNTMPINRDTYMLRCIEEGFAPSRSSGKPMITLKCEIASPETINIAGEDILVVGIKAGLTHYQVTKSVDDQGVVDEEKSKALKKSLEELYEQFGIKVDGELNVDNPPLGFKNKLVWAVLDNDRRPMLRTPTKEQLDKGIKRDAPELIMLHPQTKQPMIENWPKIVKIICPAEQPANQPY